MRYNCEAKQAYTSTRRGKNGFGRTNVPREVEDRKVSKIRLSLNTKKLHRKTKSYILLWRLENLR
jgi:hypothetical protein